MQVAGEGRAFNLLIYVFNLLGVAGEGYAFNLIAYLFNLLAFAVEGHAFNLLVYVFNLLSVAGEGHAFNLLVYVFNILAVAREGHARGVQVPRSVRILRAENLLAPHAFVQGGECNIMTCWRHMPSFREVGETL